MVKKKHKKAAATTTANRNKIVEQKPSRRQNSFLLKQKCTHVLAVRCVYIVKFAVHKHCGCWNIRWREKHCRTKKNIGINKASATLLFYFSRSVVCFTHWWWWWWSSIDRMLQILYRQKLTQIAWIQFGLSLSCYYCTDTSAVCYCCYWIYTLLY